MSWQNTVTVLGLVACAALVSILAHESNLACTLVGIAGGIAAPAVAGSGSSKAAALVVKAGPVAGALAGAAFAHLALS